MKARGFWSANLGIGALPGLLVVEIAQEVVERGQEGQLFRREIICHEACMLLMLGSLHL